MTKKPTSKKTKMIAAVAFVLGVTVIGAGVTHADAVVSSQTNRESALVTAIAQKFNLNSTDVQSIVHQVMLDQQAKMEAARQQAFADRIAKAVSEGKLTQEQAALISAKAQEVQLFMDGLKGDTEAQRQTAMKSEFDSIKQWITDNNIPKDYSLFLDFGGKGHGGQGKHQPSTTANN